MANSTVQFGSNPSGIPEGSSRKKISVFNVFLNGGNDYYLPGEDITGQVFVHCTKPFKTSGISVRLLGSCYVSDSKRHNHYNEDNYRAHYTRLEFQNKSIDGTQVSNHTLNTQDMRRYYKDTEIYFHIKQQIWGGFSSSESFQMGEFTFPFNITLPLNLPASFEGTRGYVRYTATAKIKRHRAPSVTCVKHFRVYPKVDFRSVPNSEVPVIVHDSKYYGFMMFKTGNIEAKVSLDRKGYLPGETIILNAEITNNTSKDTTLVNAALLAMVTYRVHGDVKEEKTILMQITQGAIRAHNRDVWINKELLIPQAASPSGLNGCGLIILEYRVQFTISTPIGSDMEIILPVFIGSEPSAAYAMVTSSAEAATAQWPPQKPPRPSHLAKQREVEASVQQYSIAPPPHNPIVEITGATVFSLDAERSHATRLAPPPSYDDCIAEDQKGATGQTVAGQNTTHIAMASGGPDVRQDVAQYGVQYQEQDGVQFSVQYQEQDGAQDGVQYGEQDGGQYDEQYEGMQGTQDDGLSEGQENIDTESREQAHDTMASNYRFSIANDDNKLLIDL